MNFLFCSRICPFDRLFDPLRVSTPGNAATVPKNHMALSLWSKIDFTFGGFFRISPPAPANPSDERKWPGRPARLSPTTPQPPEPTALPRKLSIRSALGLTVVSFLSDFVESPPLFIPLPGSCYRIFLRSDTHQERMIAAGCHQYRQQTARRIGRDLKPFLSELKRNFDFDISGAFRACSRGCCIPAP